jgi:hypothetical protein
VLDPDVVLHADAAAVPAGAPRQIRGARLVARGALAFAERARFARPALVHGAVAVPGTLIAARRPRHPIGWLLLLGGVWLAVPAFGAEYARYTFVVQPARCPAATGGCGPPAGQRGPTTRCPSCCCCSLPGTCYRAGGGRRCG